MSDDYEIGYKKPPKRGQFKKGQSGNPKGRPKGSRNLKTDLQEELREKVLVTEGGRKKAVSKQRAMVKTVVSKALGGDGRAIKILSDLVMQLLPQDDEVTAVRALSAEDEAIFEAFEARLANNPTDADGKGA